MIRFILKTRIWKKIAVVLPGDLSQNTQKNTATLILIAKFIFIS